MLALRSRRSWFDREIGQLQWPPDPGPHTRHVIDQRRAEGRHQQVDRPVRPALLQHPDHAMAADEVANPHIGNDQDRAGVRRVFDRHIMI